jgi:uncharacterized membrane protein YkoI
MTRTTGRTRQRRQVLAALFLALGLLGPAPAIFAAGVSMEQAVKMSEKRYHARVVKAEAQKNGGHTVYVLRLLNDSGHVWTIRVDAATGSVL